MSKQLRDFMHQLKNGRSRDYDLESNVKDLKARIHSCKLLRDDHVAKLARSKELPCLQQEFNARLQALNLCKEDLPIAISVCEKRIKHIKKILDSISQENSNKQKIGRNAAKMVFGKEFWHLYYKDLHSAQREIIIVCKFISQGRVKSLAKVLSKAIARGVRVVVVIGPPAPEHVPLVELMMSVNIEVIIRDGFHQKLSVIDQNIAWHGSLNILSHWNDQGDQMCREQEPHMVQQILSGIKELLDG
ncbi:MAG: phospholipase D-like domain-containing protein [Candidatus Melainabacteria bacterium]|nr:phospholipase D-like domain-containing protein [Candidatus Melainabacteria bacterium]